MTTIEIFREADACKDLLPLPEDPRPILYHDVETYRRMLHRPIFSDLPADGTLGTFRSRRAALLAVGSYVITCMKLECLIAAKRRDTAALNNFAKELLKNVKYIKRTLDLK
jgi:hypothetical protein